MEKMAKDYEDKGLIVAKVNVQTLSEVASIFKVSAIPDIRLFVKGKESGKVVGYDPAQIENMARGALGLEVTTATSATSVSDDDPFDEVEQPPFPTIPVDLGPNPADGDPAVAPEPAAPEPVVLGLPAADSETVTP